MADRKRIAADQSDAHAAETIRLLSRGPSNGRGGDNVHDDHDEGEFDDDVDSNLDSNLDSADGHADGDSYLDDSGGDNASSSRHSSERGPLARGGAGAGTTRAQQNEHLRRRRRRTAGLLCVITFVLLFALAIAAGIDRRHKNGDNDGGGVGPRVNLGYAHYAGTRLPNVYPPSSNGGSDHDTRASPIAVNKFLGMRYAAPPVGARRWQAPAPPDNETAPQAATDFRPICLGMGADPAPGSGQAEDCLFVNVWAPASAMDDAAAADETASAKGVPVWVFIQGGGYVANSNPNIDGADVVARSGGHVVFVNFSYRVGLYGFLAAPGTAADVVPNAGLLDQRALLAWVQEHIHRFGGDPRHVVVHGGSAGAGSVALHTVAYGGRDDGLFVGVVAQSVFVPTLPTCADVTYKFWRAVHAVCPDRKDDDDDDDDKAVGDALACLRKTPVELLQQRANVPSSFQFRGNASTEGPGIAGFYWGPCVDGDLLVDRPSVLFRQGRYVRVPMLYGVASDEGTLLVANAASQDDVVGFIVSNYPGLGPAGEAGTAASVIAQHYPQAPAVPQHAPWFPTLAHVYGEVTFVCPAVNTLDAVAAATTNKSAAPRPALFAYRYAMQDPGLMAAGLGTVHMMDAAAVFGPRNVICCPPASYFRPDDGSTSPEEDRNGNPGLVPVMMDYFISFVRTLDPNTHKSPHAADWVPWGRPEERTDADRRQRLVVYTGGHQAMETVPDDQSARCRVWLDLADRLEQ
ncbi:hypothetical protein SPBR_03435 [Sporothrix brasiliensis 5110]|uniref:Carboxylesterase type B domain-containing protein n=1 Tax=Sporothrix brasiliensis 5110 TaxID=1398154 RepID=A0A0C2FVX8_9PEZI|nr:uncharacterized protein SPBR_03435 [Sporothrix brasiliensis 5110]KIH95138.1 hypothetical protein SPBR_03435 [Sporothrix brasiliensis 5110]